MVALPAGTDVVDDVDDDDDDDDDDDINDRLTVVSLSSDNAADVATASS